MSVRRIVRWRLREGAWPAARVLAAILDGQHRVGLGAVWAQEVPIRNLPAKARAQLRYLLAAHMTVEDYAGVWRLLGGRVPREWRDEADRPPVTIPLVLTRAMAYAGEGGWRPATGEPLPWVCAIWALQDASDRPVLVREAAGHLAGLCGSTPEDLLRQVKIRTGARPAPPGRPAPPPARAGKPTPAAPLDANDWEPYAAPPKGDRGGD